MDRKVHTGGTPARPNQGARGESFARLSEAPDSQLPAVVAGTAATDERRSATRDRVGIAEGTGVVLLSDDQARALIGVGSRTWAELKASADWLPAPIILGPRLCRWDRDELLHALRTRAPRGQRVAEPEQLRRARIDRLKGKC